MVSQATGTSLRAELADLTRWTMPLRMLYDRTPSIKRTFGWDLFRIVTVLIGDDAVVQGLMC